MLLAPDRDLSGCAPPLREQGANACATLIEEPPEFAPQRVARPTAKFYADVGSSPAMGRHPARLHAHNHEPREVQQGGALAVAISLFLFRQKGKNALARGRNCSEPRRRRPAPMIVRAMPYDGQFGGWGGRLGVAGGPRSAAEPRSREAPLHPYRPCLRGDISETHADADSRLRLADEGTLGRSSEQAQASDPKRLRSRSSQLGEQMRGSSASIDGTVLESEPRRAKADGKTVTRAIPSSIHLAEAAHGRGPPPRNEPSRPRSSMPSRLADSRPERAVPTQNRLRFFTPIQRAPAGAQAFHPQTPSAT